MEFCLLNVTVFPQNTHNSQIISQLEDSCECGLTDNTQHMFCHPPDISALRVKTELSSWKRLEWINLKIPWKR